MSSYFHMPILLYDWNIESVCIIQKYIKYFLEPKSIERKNTVEKEVATD